MVARPIATWSQQAGIRKANLSAGQSSTSINCFYFSQPTAVSRETAPTIARLTDTTQKLTDAAAKLAEIADWVERTADKMPLHGDFIERNVKAPLAA